MTKVPTQELAGRPAIEVLAIPEDLSFMYLGDKVVFNGSHRPWTYDPELKQSRPPQSWEAATHDIKQGYGVYLITEAGSWHVELFSFNETEPPRVDDFKLQRWDWKSMGAPEDHADWFAGSLRVTNYCESASMHFAAFGSRDLRYKSEEDATHRGDDILIYSGKANGWNKGPSVGEGKVARPAGKHVRFATRLFTESDEVVELFGRITRGRLSDSDRALVWKAVEEQLSALDSARAERETVLAGLKSNQNTSGNANLPIPAPEVLTADNTKSRMSTLDGLAALVRRFIS